MVLCRTTRSRLLAVFIAGPLLCHPRPGTSFYRGHQAARACAHPMHVWHRIGLQTIPWYYASVRDAQHRVPGIMVQLWGHLPGYQWNLSSQLMPQEDPQGGPEMISNHGIVPYQVVEDPMPQGFDAVQALGAGQTSHSFQWLTGNFRQSRCGVGMARARHHHIWNLNFEIENPSAWYEYGRYPAGYGRGSTPWHYIK